MKNKRIFKSLAALCAAMVLMMGLSVTAFAQGTDQPPAEDATNDSNVVVEETAVSYTHLLLCRFGTAGKTRQGGV